LNGVTCFAGSTFYQRRSYSCMDCECSGSFETLFFHSPSFQPPRDIYYNLSPLSPMHSLGIIQHDGHGRARDESIIQICISIQVYAQAILSSIHEAKLQYPYPSIHPSIKVSVSNPSNILTSDRSSSKDRSLFFPIPHRLLFLPNKQTHSKPRERTEHHLLLCPIS
jgi:hypothetical protein